MIKAVIYDLDNTLYDFHTPNKEAVKLLAEKASVMLDVTEKEFLKAFNDVYDEYKIELARRLGEPEGSEFSSNHERSIRMQRTLRRLKKPIYPYTLELYHIYWDYLLSHLVPEEGIEDTLKALKAKGYILGVGTNMSSPIQYEKVERLGLGPYFDFVIASDETVYDKPDKRFFDLLLEVSGCQPQECVFIGDNLRLDYQGAFNAGMLPVWYNFFDKPASEGLNMIQKHSEIFRFLEEV